MELSALPCSVHIAFAPTRVMAFSEWSIQFPDFADKRIENGLMAYKKHPSLAFPVGTGAPAVTQEERCRHVFGYRDWLRSEIPVRLEEALRSDPHEDVLWREPGGGSRSICPGECYTIIEEMKLAPFIRLNLSRVEKNKGGKYILVFFYSNEF